MQIQYRIFPRALRDARNRMGMRQADAARALGISRQRLWNYENGTAQMPGDLLARLCLLYDVEIRDLLFCEESHSKVSNCNSGGDYDTL